MKQLGKDNVVICPSNTFVLLSNSPAIEMRNIPGNDDYLAVLLELEYSDFNQFEHDRKNNTTFIQGDIEPILEKTLQQFIEWSLYAPADAWHFRRKELLQIIYQLGHLDISTIAEPPSLSHKIHDIVREDISKNIGVEIIATKLAMSESTLRRKLKAEGANIQTIKTQAKLGHGLHLIQTSMEPIGRIAEACGYQSQSRFTDKFKELFGLTPSDLRKTRMND